MKIFGLAALAAGVLALSASFGNPAVAGNTDDGTKLTGKHFNLNIIGVEKGKKADMTNSNRHTIFMPLRSGKSDGIPDARIWLNPGEEFLVCDGNGSDPAYDCDGNQISSSGAVFELPCNLYLTQPPQTIVVDGQDVEIVSIISCNQVVDDQGNIIDLDPKVFPEASYTVWARALGQPNNSAEIETCATVQGDLVCSMESAILTRTKGKSSFTNVTDELTSLVVVYCFREDAATGECLDARVTRVALFAGDTEDWFWGYTNDGLRLAQIRFYPEPLANGQN